MRNTLTFLNGQKSDPIAIGLTLLHKLFLYDVLSIRQKIILADFRLRRDKFTEVSRRSTQIKHLTFVANLPAIENFLKLVKYFLKHTNHKDCYFKTFFLVSSCHCGKNGSFETDSFDEES